MNKNIAPNVQNINAMWLFLAVVSLRDFMVLHVEYDEDRANKIEMIIIIPMQHVAIQFNGLEMWSILVNCYAEMQKFKNLKKSLGQTFLKS